MMKYLRLLILGVMLFVFASSTYALTDDPNGPSGNDGDTHVVFLPLVNGRVDDSPKCTDSDGDGYAIEGGECGPVDCNDGDTDINPGATELCNNGLDDDCDGLADAADPICSNPEIDIEKYISIDGGLTWVDADLTTGPYLNAGTSPQFKFVVSNSGNFSLTDVSLTDSDFDLSGCTIPSTLDVEGSFECVITVGWAEGQHTNTATASGDFTDGNGDTETSTDTDAANYFGSNPEIDVEKYISIDGGLTWVDADLATGPYLNSSIDPQFKFVVSNTGNVELSNVDVTDDMFGNISLDGTLAVGASVEYFITDAAWAEGQHTNSATASGDFTDGNGDTETSTDTDAANYFGSNPEIDVEKYVSIDGGLTWVDADLATGPYLNSGIDPQFKFVVSNTGNVELFNVDVTDDVFGNISLDGTLAVGASVEYFITDAVWAEGQHTNSATASGDFTDGNGDTEIGSDTDAANYFGSDTPNIVVVGWDGLQRDHFFECYNKELPECADWQPNIGALSGGTIFNNTITNGSTSTKPGWAQIFTGYNAEVTGVYDLTNYQPIPEGYTVFEKIENHFGPENVVTMFISAKGVHTGGACIGDSTYKNGEPVIEDKGQPWCLTKDHLDYFELEQTADDDLGNRALELLEIHQDDFFFALFLFRTPDIIGHLSGEDSVEYSESFMYDDYWLGQIMAKLQELGIDDQTLVYVVSDHGFDEGLSVHLNAPYDIHATNDPLVIRSGDRKDLGPTFLERYGISLGQIGPAPPVNGHSLYSIPYSEPPSCVPEGEAFLDYPGAPVCCPGLDLIGLDLKYGGCRVPTGGIGDNSGHCTNCGNGSCDAPENACNCPEDCS